MKTNKDWHEKHKMPKNATFEQRVAWHLEHVKNCACRPIPKKLAEAMAKKQIAS
jgi:hypothetical protein